MENGFDGHDFDGRGLETILDTAAESRAVRRTDMVRETVEWLWKPYIPLGRVTMLEGDPGVGKSWLSLAIGAAVSRGQGLPGTNPTEPANVLVVNYEDGPTDTIAPRLDDLGADGERVFIMCGRPLTLEAQPGNEGLKLESFILECDARLVIVDPLVVLLGPNVDLHRANETRACMNVLADIAQRRKCAILCVRHLTKSSKDRSIYRGIGSIDLTGVCRSVLLAGKDPHNHDRRALVHIKSNLAPLGPSQGFEIREGCFYWTGESDLTASRILAPEGDDDSHSALEEAVSFLATVLADGPVPVKDIQRQAKECGIADKTLRRAKRELGVVAKRANDPGSKRGSGSWLWVLPDPVQDGQAVQDGQVGHLERVRIK